MSEWKEYKIKDLGLVVTGKTPSSTFPEEFGSEMPFVTPTDFRNYRKLTSFAERNLSAKGIEKLRNKILPPSSVLVTCIGSDMGKIVMNRVPVITNQQINAIIPNQELVSPDFLYYMLIDCYETLRMYSQAGTAVPILNKGDFEEINLTIPSDLSEQKAIASILSSLDDKIDLLHRQNKTLEALAETLFRQWFVEEAEGCETGKLGDFGKIICGKTPSKKIHSYFGGNIPFIKIPDMHGKTFIFDTVDTLTEEGANSQQNKFLPAKSICVSCIATVGLVTMNALNSQTNQQINSIIPSKEIYRYFIYLKLATMKDELRAMASGGTATDNLNTGDFSNIEIIKPEDKVLELFHNQVQPYFDKIFANQIQIRTLTRLRDTLLPKLMSGEVRVKDAERVVEKNV